MLIIFSEVLQMHWMSAN